MPPLSEKELEQRLVAVGETLVQLPSSLDEVLPLLDQIEGLLEKVEQSPAKSLQNALSPLTTALVREDLLKHPDVDVKVCVASCISEITRITAPDAPYDDDRMKDIFQLIVSSFEDLSDTSSRSYKKRTSILETVAKVRSCVIMLDLECDQMIIEMFQHFLKAMRVEHPEIVVTSMEAVMTLVLEESEDISPDLLAPILTLLKRNNEAAIPIAKKFAERVIQNSADKLRPYLRQAVKYLHTSLDDYSEVVASLCRENTDTVRHSSKKVVEGEYTCPPAQHPLAGKDDSEGTNSQDKDPTATVSQNPVVSNGISETRPEEILTDANSLKSADSDRQLDAKPISKTESDDFNVQKPVNSEAKEELAESQQMFFNHEVPDKDVHTSTEVKPAEAGTCPDKEEGSVQHSLSDAPENEAVIVASPTQSGNHPDESRSETVMSGMGKGNLGSEGMVSDGTASEKASEGDTEAKKQHLGMKRTGDSADKDKTLTEEVASRNNDGYTSDSEAQSLEQAEKGEENLVTKDMVSVETASKKASEEESISEAKKQQQAKKQTTDTADRDKSLSKEVASMNDDGCASDSEAQSLDQAEKGKGNLVMKEVVPVDNVSKKASEGESTEAKMQHLPGKKRNADSDRTLTEEVASKNGDGCASDSEAQSLDQAEKGMGNLDMKEMASVDTACEKASEGKSVSETKKQQRQGKTPSADSADKDNTLPKEVASRNNYGCTSDSEAESLKKAEKGNGNLVLEDVVPVDAASKKAFEGESISEAKKQRRSGKNRTADLANKGKTLLSVEVTSKNDDGSVSDSEAQSPDQEEKGKGNLVMKEAVSVDTASKKTSERESISKANKLHLGKKRTTDSADMGKTLTVEVTSKNDNDYASDSEARSLDQVEKGKRTLVSDDMISVDSASKKASEGESISQAKKQRRSRKKQTADSASKRKKLIVQVASKSGDDRASDSEPRLLDQPKKLEDASNKTDHESSLRGEDSKKSGRSKHASNKDVPRSAREDHGKVTITSQKSPLKSTKTEQEETPRMSNKRKQTPGKEKVSETPEYGKNLIGSKVKVWWPKDQMFYEGEIASFDPVKKKHKVVYTDGDEEVLNLKRERWEFVGDDLVPDGDKVDEHSSQDTSSDMRRKKKGKSNLETSSKRQKVEHSPKSKLSKSGGKSKDEGKAEAESNDKRSKPSNKSAEDPIKSKDQTQKVGGGGQVDSTKASGRSKEVAKVSSQVKQDSERTSKSKDKTPQSGKTPGSGGTKLTKSSSSKVKEADLTRERTPGTAKSLETAKRKSALESESKSGKKRRR